MSLNLLYNVQLDQEYEEGSLKSQLFTKFGTFAPDGSCFSLITSNNSVLFYDIDKNAEKISENSTNNITNGNASDLKPSLTIEINEDIRDFCWFPNYNKTDPDSRCFLLAARNKPVNLYDSFTGSNHFTYKAINSVGELPQIYSINFHPLGKYFLCGSLSCIYVFDIQSPGEHIEFRKLSTRKSSGQKGIISCISHNTFGSGNTYACGSYNSTVSIYDHNESRTVSLVGDFLDPDYPINPVTHIKWINETNILVGCRNDFYLRLYDIRGDLSTPVQRYHRPVTTNQKVTFDFKDDLIVSGTSDGDLLFYDLNGNLVYNEHLSTLPIPVSNYNPNLPLLLVSSGTRNFEDYNLDSPVQNSEPTQNSDDKPFVRLYYNYNVK